MILQYNQLKIGDLIKHTSDDFWINEFKNLTRRIVKITPDQVKLEYLINIKYQSSTKRSSTKRIGEIDDYSRDSVEKHFILHKPIIPKYLSGENE